MLCSNIGEELKTTNISRKRVPETSVASLPALCRVSLYTVQNTRFAASCSLIGSFCRSACCVKLMPARWGFSRYA